MRSIIVAILLVQIAGCYGVGDYRQAENPSQQFIDPKDYRVDPNLYPKYRAIRDFQPPDLFSNPHNEQRLQMPRITTNYVWEVRHRVGDQLWIYSDKYHEQECKVQRCYGAQVFQIAIKTDGRALSGWRQIENPKYVLLKGDRIISITPDRDDLEWGSEPLFEVINGR